MIAENNIIQTVTATKAISIEVKRFVPSISFATLFFTPAIHTESAHRV